MAEAVKIISSLLPPTKVGKPIGDFGSKPEQHNPATTMAEAVKKTMTVDIVSLLTSDGSKQGGFLVNRLGDKVNVEDLRGKTVGLYFERTKCGPGWESFAKVLERIYKKLLDENKKIEFILIGAPSEDEDSFKYLISAMPWLAIPFSSAGFEVAGKVRRTFNVHGYPHLVFIDEVGNVYQDHDTKWIYIVQDYEAEAYPFTAERVEQLKEEDAIGKENVAIITLFNSSNYLITKDGEKIPCLDQLEGKTVFLAFLCFMYNGMHTEFIRKLKEIYNELIEREENFEIVMIVSDDDDKDYKQYETESIPWAALPFKDKVSLKLKRYFRPFIHPMVVIFGPDGKQLRDNGFELIEDYGIEACPFTAEKLDELNWNRKESYKMMTVQSLLVAEGKEFVLDNSSCEVPVTDLLGKHIFFYFTLGWTEDGHELTGLLTEAYFEAKEKSDKFEVIYIPFGEAETVFEHFVSALPWLHLPLHDPRVEPMYNKFQRPKPTPYMVALRPDGGGAYTTEDGELQVVYGDDVPSFFQNVCAELSDDD